MLNLPIHLTQPACLFPTTLNFLDFITPPTHPTPILSLAAKWPLSIPFAVCRSGPCLSCKMPLPMGEPYEKRKDHS